MRRYGGDGHDIPGAHGPGRSRSDREGAPASQTHNRKRPDPAAGGNEGPIQAGLNGNLGGRAVANSHGTDNSRGA